MGEKADSYKTLGQQNIEKAEEAARAKRREAEIAKVKA